MVQHLEVTRCIFAINQTQLIKVMCILIILVTIIKSTVIINNHIQISKEVQPMQISKLYNTKCTLSSSPEESFCFLKP